MKFLYILICTLLFNVSAVSQKTVSISKENKQTSSASETAKSNEPLKKKEFNSQKSKVSSKKAKTSDSLPAIKPTVSSVNKHNRTGTADVPLSPEKSTVANSVMVIEEQPSSTRQAITIETESNKSQVEPTKETTTSQGQTSPPIDPIEWPEPAPVALTDEEIQAVVRNNPDRYHFFCRTTCALCCRCNSVWYYRWYNGFNKNCNWTGDVTFVNNSADTLELYTEEHQAVDMPTAASAGQSPIYNKELYSFLVLVPGDSLTFKMPCGALKYQAVVKGTDRDYLRSTIGWVRSVSYDVRVELKDEDLD